MEERKRARKKRDQIWLASISFLLLLLGVLIYLAVSCVGRENRPKPVPDETVPDAGTSAAGTTDVPAAESVADPAERKCSDRAAFVFVGDVLIHQSLINAGERADGSYDFAPLFRHTRDILSAADVAAFDMEGTFSGAPYSGYPAFSTPEDLRTALRGAGFEIAVTANNHAMDFDVPGMKRTAEQLREGGFTVLGTRTDAGDPAYVIREVNGMKIGLTAFTYESDLVDEYRSLNFVPIPHDCEELIDSVYVGTDRPDLMEADGKKIEDRIRKMREDGAEAILVYFHWGTEYAAGEDAGQVYYAQLLADLKVDAVVACGPHVIQPIRSIASEDGSHQMLCYYSVGNFVSNQQYDTGNSEGRAQDGLIALLSFARNEEGKVVLSDCGYIATFVYKQYPKGADEEFTDAVTVPLRAALGKPDSYGLNEDAVRELEESLERIRFVMDQNTPGNLSLTEYSTYFTP